MTGTGEIIYSSSMFGEYSPYLYLKDGKAVISDSISEVVAGLGEGSVELDVASVLSLLNFNYILGDRTLVKGVTKVPWHSDVKNDGSVVRRPPLPHDSIILSEKDVASKICHLLSKYLLDDVLKEHSTIWLTLSGGYDSRIIAGIIHKILPRNHAVCVLTWGLESSLDVAYSRRIAERYGWEFLHVPFYDGYLDDIIQYAVDEGGAETSPIDYNPIETNDFVLKRISEQDAIIFAHYGDGIGRALYQGSHISNISLKNIHNPYCLFNYKILQTCKKVIAADRELAWAKDYSAENVKKIAINELDMHENYMRRMLTKRFSHCKKYDPFTCDELVRFVYSISVECRTSNVYEHILGELDDYLVELPYANTGVSFSGRAEENDRLNNKTHNKSYEFLGRYGEVKTLLQGGKLIENNIINPRALENLLAIWPNDVSLSSLVSRLFVIEKFIQRYNVEVSLYERGVVSEYAGGIGGQLYSCAKKIKRNFSGVGRRA